MFYLEAVYWFILIIPRNTVVVIPIVRHKSVQDTGGRITHTRTRRSVLVLEKVPNCSSMV
jgi:hypothetical protein